MANRILLAALMLALTTLGCAPQDASEAIVRTGDPYARGFTDEDFPRVQQLADGVYSYEQLRSAGEEKFTTVSLFVVTPQGVLVADGQGSLAETQLMVEKIAEITDQPITHVVVCSDHGDHTAGNAAFPEDAVFLAHPTSQANLQARSTGRCGAGADPDRASRGHQGASTR